MPLAYKNKQRLKMFFLHWKGKFHSLNPFSPFIEEEPKIDVRLIVEPGGRLRVHIKEGEGPS